MIGEFITITWIEKRGLVEGTKFMALVVFFELVASALLALVINTANLPNILVWLLSFILVFVIQYPVLKYLMKYPKNRITRVILTAYGINVGITIGILVLLGAGIATLILSSILGPTARAMLVLP